jgi:hypothetical protein
LIGFLESKGNNNNSKTKKQNPFHSLPPLIHHFHREQFGNYKTRFHEQFGTYVTKYPDSLISEPEIGISGPDPPPLILS